MNVWIMSWLVKRKMGVSECVDFVMTCKMKMVWTKVGELVFDKNLHQRPCVWCSLPSQVGDTPQTGWSYVDTVDFPRVPTWSRLPKPGSHLEDFQPLIWVYSHIHLLGHTVTPIHAMYVLQPIKFGASLYIQTRLKRHYCIECSCE